MASTRTPGSGDYEVGYGKPPKATQFQKGQSGNPNGRAKGAKGLRTILTEVVHARQTIRIAGEPVTGSRLQLMVLTLATRAAAGDLKATEKLVPLVIQYLGVEDPGKDRQTLSPHDQALLDQWMAEDEVPEEVEGDAGSLFGDPNQAEPAPDEAADEDQSGSEEEGGQDADDTP